MFLSPGATGNLKAEKTTELHSVVLHLTPVTFPDHFPTECTEDEVLVRAASDICQEQVITFLRQDPSS